MNVSPADLEFCLSQANHITHHFELMSLAKDHPVRDIGELLRTFEHSLGATVSVAEVQVSKDDSWVLGMCILSADKRVEIGLAQGLNECYGRFVLCKELFHVALDRPEYRNINLSGHVEEFTLTFPDDDSKPRKPVVAEFLAEVGAMELLLPYKQRVAVLRDDARPDTQKVAEKFKVPRVYVQRYLSASYMDNLGRFSLV